MVMAALALAGCATPVNWQARVGVYTYDQARKDYGNPISVTKFTDNSFVAQWATTRGKVAVTPGKKSADSGAYYRRGFYGPAWGYPAYRSTYFPGNYLRLRFGPDDRLMSWKKYSR